MAAETGNTYISETMRAIPTANVGFTTAQGSKKESVSDFNRASKKIYCVSKNVPLLFFMITSANADRF